MSLKEQVKALLLCTYCRRCVDVPGMYDFSVTLSGDVKSRAKLLRLANPDYKSDDDNIAEFYGADGEEINAVPEDRKINVSAWLNAGRVYNPAIAVKQ